MEHPYQLQLSLMLALMYYGYIYASGTKIGKEIADEAMFDYPDYAWKTSFGLVFLYLVYSLATGGVHAPTALKTSAYLLVPTFMLWHVRKKSDHITKWDWLAVFTLWIFFDLHLIGSRAESMKLKNVLDWPIIAVSSVIIAITFWVHQRKIQGIKLEFSFWKSEMFKRWHDLELALLGFGVLIVVLLPLGFAIDFLHPKPYVLVAFAKNELTEAICTHIMSLEYLKVFAYIFFTIALSEELLFRGIIQNFLEQVTNRPTRAWIFASILFGAAHLNNGATSLDPLDWNWKYMLMATVAGLVYGKVFQKANSILASMTLHALVDVTWHEFFV